MIRHKINNLVAAGFLSLAIAAPVAAQVSGGVTTSGAVNPGDIAVFKNKAQIKSGSGTPLTGQCYIYTGTYPSGSWGPGACSGGAAGPASIQVTAASSKLTVSPGTACATGACAFALDINAAAMITSFNGRFGAVVPAINDYSFAMVSGSAACTQMPAYTGDVTSAAGGCVNTLASIVTAGGPTGDAGHVAQITYDAKGRITAVTSIAITYAGIGNAPCSVLPAFTGIVSTTAGSCATVVATASGIKQVGGNIVLDQAWRGFVTAAQYGVTCDGVTNDATNFQTFLTALSTSPWPLGIVNGTSGGSVCFMGTTALNVDKGAVILGGTNQTTLKWSSTTSRMIQNLTSSSSNVTMEHLILDGTTKSSQIGVYILGSLAGANSPSGWHLEDMEINNVSDCFYADSGGSSFASNYHIVHNTSCSNADIGYSFVTTANSNIVEDSRCGTVGTCMFDSGDNNSSSHVRMEVTTVGIQLNASSTGYTSTGDRFENAPTSGTGILTIAGASRATVTAPYFAGLSTTINDAANALINSPFEYRVSVAFNSAVPANLSTDTLINTGIMANCKASAEVTATVDGGTAPTGVFFVGMYRIANGPYIRAINVTGSSVTPNTTIVLTCRQRS